MRHRLFGISLVFVVTLFAVHFAVAAEFSKNSADITHTYAYKKVGTRLIRKHGGTDNVRHYSYEDNVTIEKVDGVNCLRMTAVDTFSSLFVTLWFAQDISGDVYVLKIFDKDNGTPIILGKNGAGLVFPKSFQVGDVVNVFETVVEVGVTVGQLSTGLGPYTNCIKTELANGDFHYWAPNVGTVKVESTDIERRLELEEVIQVKSMVTVIPFF